MHLSHVETVVSLSKGNIDSERLKVEFSMENFTIPKVSHATYPMIKSYVLEQTGLKVSTLNIAQMKQKYGIIERENYNKAKSDESRQPQCVPEKEDAISDAFRHFGMI